MVDSIFSDSFKQFSGGDELGSSSLQSGSAELNAADTLFANTKDPFSAFIAGRELRKGTDKAKAFDELENSMKLMKEQVAQQKALAEAHKAQITANSEKNKQNITNQARIAYNSSDPIIRDSALTEIAKAMYNDYSIAGKKVAIEDVKSLANGKDAVITMNVDGKRMQNTTNIDTALSQALGVEVFNQVKGRQGKLETITIKTKSGQLRSIPAFLNASGEYEDAQGNPVTAQFATEADIQAATTRATGLAEAEVARNIVSGEAGQGLNQAQRETLAGIRAPRREDVLTTGTPEQMGFEKPSSRDKETQDTLEGLKASLDVASAAKDITAQVKANPQAIGSVGGIMNAIQAGKFTAAGIADAFVTSGTIDEKDSQVMKEFLDEQLGDSNISETAKARGSLFVAVNTMRYKIAKALDPGGRIAKDDVENVGLDVTSILANPSNFEGQLEQSIKNALSESRNRQQTLSAKSSGELSASDFNKIRALKVGEESLMEALTSLQNSGVEERNINGVKFKIRRK